MLLAVDIGNTNVAFGLYEGDELKQTFRCETVRSRTAEEYAILLRQMLMLRGFEPDAVKSAILASVVPPLTDVMVDAIHHAFSQETLVVGPGLKTGISILYENPKDVGADRVVNAVAAYDLVRDAVIVVDFGTATTFDCISAKGEYLGGVIVPGIQVSLDGLLARAAKLSRIEVTAPPRVLGRNTTHALQSGIVYGYASLVDGLVEKLSDELGYRCEVIGTGGLATLIAQYTKSLSRIDDTLTLYGLRILHAKNSARQRGTLAD